MDITTDIAAPRFAPFDHLRPQDMLWVRKRLPKIVLALMKEKGRSVVLAGGFIRGAIANESLSDVDLFVPSPEKGMEFAKLIGDRKGKRIIQTQNAITVIGYGMPIQFITRWTYQWPHEVVESFDFTIAMAAMFYNKPEEPADPDKVSAAPGWMSLCHRDFYADLAAKRLIYTSPVRNEDAGGSFLRVLKFYQRDYRIPLDSMGAVIARLIQGINFSHVNHSHKMFTSEAGGSPQEGLVPDEDRMAFLITGLLREVDPQIDPDHFAHLPTLKEAAEEEQQQVEDDARADLFRVAEDTTTTTE